MFTLRNITFVLIAAFVSAASFGAGNAGSLEGTVRDTTGQPVRGAEIRILGKGDKIVASTRTDAKGHYSCASLAAGVYKVDLLIDSKSQASIPNVQTKSAGLTQANFDLRMAKKTVAAQRRKVWVQETGSNLGRWEEVDEKGQIKNSPSTRNLLKGDASYLRSMQDRTAGAMGGP